MHYSDLEADSEITSTDPIAGITFSQFPTVVIKAAPTAAFKQSVPPTELCFEKLLSEGWAIKEPLGPQVTHGSLSVTGGWVVVLSMLGYWLLA